MAPSVWSLLAAVPVFSQVAVKLWCSSLRPIIDCPVCAQVNTFGGQIMAWMVNVAMIAARYKVTQISKHFLKHLLRICLNLGFRACSFTSTQSPVSGSPDSSNHRHVHFQRTFKGGRPAAVEGYSQQCLQKQVWVSSSRRTAGGERCCGSRNLCLIDAFCSVQLGGGSACRSLPGGGA